MSKGTTRTCTTATLSEEVYHSVSQVFFFSHSTPFLPYVRAHSSHISP